MNKWTTSVIALSLCFSSSCGKKSKHYQPTSQELRLNLHGEPPTLDPRKATDTVSLSVIKMCFEGLTRIDAQGHPIPALAEKIEISEDQLHYTFSLREAYWSDGTKITAQDFEKNWKTILSPTFASEIAVDLYCIKNAKAAKANRCSLDEVGVKALNESTLKVELEHPVPYLLSALATHPFFATPYHITSAYKDWLDGHYVCNGPFYIKEWRHHDVILLEKNPQYWDRDQVRLEKVSLLLIEDESTELSMFENNELDWAGYPLSTLPIDALTSLESKGELHKYSIAGTYFYIFNTKEFPFNNVHIRRAFALAINRQGIINNVTQMHQPPAMSLVPPMLWKYPQNYFKDYDIEEAKRQFAIGLDELGISAQEFPQVTLSYNTMSAHHKIAQAIQEQWNYVLGVKVKLENKEWKVFLDELRHHKFQIARMGALANVKDPITFLDYYRYLSSSQNHSQWSNPKFSELLERADYTKDVEERSSLLKAAEKVLMDEMPVAPIYFYTGAYLKKPYVKGIHISQLNDLDLKWAYVEINDQVSP